MISSVVLVFLPAILSYRVLQTLHSSSSGSLLPAAMNNPVLITACDLNSILSHNALIDHFHASLPNLSPSIHTPLRQNYAVSPSSSLLLMPSWSSSAALPFLGVKLVTHFPNNSSLNLPGVQATYALFSSATGQPLASIDATLLTLFRTAAISGLASKLLSRSDSHTLVMIGAGNLAPHLIRAHFAARPSLRRVFIWNRNPKKAADLVENLRQCSDFDGVCLESKECLDEVIGLGDIVTCATNSETAIVGGERLKAGAHLDLVGSFTPAMKECDDEAIRRGRVWVDNEAATAEAGELVGAFDRGVIGEDDIQGDLAELIGGGGVGRKSNEEITVFKSVGSAAVDLLAAQFVYQTYMAQK